MVKVQSPVLVDERLGVKQASMGENGKAKPNSVSIKIALARANMAPMLVGQGIFWLFPRIDPAALEFAVEILADDTCWPGQSIKILCEVLC